jgi:hypothetical protein
MYHANHHNHHNPHNPHNPKINKIPATKIHTCAENPFIPFIQKIFKNKYNYSGQLHQLQTLLDKLSEEEKEKCIKIQTLGKNDRECPFIRDFHEAVDASPEFNDAYREFIRHNILPLFPLEKNLVIQKTPNIRFSFPTSAAIGNWNKDIRMDPIPIQTTSDIIGLHCDSDFGHHFAEMNFIIPVTPMYDSNSVYYESTRSYDSEEDTNPEFGYENVIITDPQHQFFQGYLNKLRHFNRVNQTGNTRISFDMRVIPYTEYIEFLDAFRGTKFELGKYYVVLYQ